MKHKENKVPLDSKGRFHGYNVRYAYDDTLRLRLVYKHGREIGYEEWHEYKKTNFYIR
jgi:hypothetical protein